MKLLIKANNRINNLYVSKNINGEIKEIEIEFEPYYPWSDLEFLEFWLTNSESKTFSDYAKMNISKRGKMKFSK